MTFKQRERAEWLRAERELWVMNDHPLYLAWKASGLRIGAFIARNWRAIDSVARRVGGEACMRSNR